VLDTGLELLRLPLPQDQGHRVILRLLPALGPSAALPIEHTVTVSKQWATTVTVSVAIVSILVTYFSTLRGVGGSCLISSIFSAPLCCYSTNS
jgi:hypothetical protein